MCEQARLDAHRMQTRAPGHLCTRSAVAFSSSRRVHTHRHTHTCAHTPCHVLSSTGTWSVHRTKKRWSPANSRQGSCKSPLPLPLNPPLQPLCSSASSCLDVHNRRERKKSCDVGAQPAVAQLHHTTHRTTVSGTGGRQQAGLSARAFIHSADRSGACRDETQALHYMCPACQKIPSQWWGWCRD